MQFAYSICLPVVPWCHLLALSLILWILTVWESPSPVHWPQFPTMWSLTIWGPSWPCPLSPVPELYFNICWEGVVNVALNKPAWQSSEFYGHPASLATDGNRNPDYYNGSCSHTGRDDGPWLTVDLQEEYFVTMVRITNRGDCCCKALTFSRRRNAPLLRRHVILGIIKAHYNTVKTSPSNVNCGNINAIAMDPTHVWQIQRYHHH